MLFAKIFIGFSSHKGLIIITWLAENGVCCRPDSSSLSNCKAWYECIVADHAALIDLYYKYSSGQLDNSEPISDQYAVTGMITCALGCSKTDNLIRVSVTVLVGGVSSLGNYVEI